MTTAELIRDLCKKQNISLAQLKTAEGITEKLKTANPMLWTQRMNSIAARAEEIIREELIYNG